MARMGILARVLWLSLKFFGFPLRAVASVKKLVDKRKSIHGIPGIVKYVAAGGRYFWSVDSPGWSSRAFDSFITTELRRATGQSDVPGTLQTVILAITNRCPLKCSHCYEWNNIDEKDRLKLTDLIKILQVLKENGIGHLQLSGGEPLARFEDLLTIIRETGPDIDSWILTSGFGLTSEMAGRLKEAGLTGANISLDHWDEREHNVFRNHQRSFHWARQAVLNCRENDIVVSLSLCATSEFATWENLGKYAELAKDWGAGFIRILEPRRVGKFAGRDSRLGKEQLDILDDFYLAMNRESKYREYPIISYPGYHQRRMGCFGAGNRYLYIDSNGDYQACPFCQNGQGNALTTEISVAIKKMKANGCHIYPSNHN